MKLEEIPEYLPYYLTEEKKEGLALALKDFPEKINYFTNQHFEFGTVLQGDGWKGFDVVNIQSMEKKSIKGMVLSNSCDISIANPRDIPTSIVFAPIISLNSYEDKLKESGISEERIRSKFQSIKKQEVTSLFYLPASGDLEESIILLDNLHSLPVRYFQEKTSRKKVFTLSQIGFYLFLFKLSIHFCRFHENLQRGN